MNRRRPHRRRLRAQAWDLRGWVVLAVLVSVALHFCLISVLRAYTFSWVGANIDVPTELPFTVDRITINEALLAPDFDDSEVAPFMPDNMQTEADIIEVAEAVAERELMLTPAVEMPSNLMLSKTPQVAGGPDLSSALTPDIDLPSPLEAQFENELASLSETALKTMPSMSENQPIIDLGDQETESVAGSAEAFLDELKEAAAKGSSGETVEGYANLDDLLNFKGPLLDNSKPILMPTDLLFGYDQVELQDSARLSLMKLGILIQKNPGSTFTIEGHTDTTGGAEYNQTLSERRALAVKAWLSRSLQISGDQIKTVGYGETRPIANPQGSIEEQALNRRVEINFKPGAAGEPRIERAVPVN